ncbi:NAD(P)H-dependent oxidoreductase [Haloactinopolyspora sp.]|uniref:NADPH-dependent FMN reductase n=1 Tax=Haloactinopolyspora sp. TaxID=1966353 RepID=UPI0026283187|nr:NAD(P)H-dependent oxidoreductase [Haloactinopolyspora sp.]
MTIAANVTESNGHTFSPASSFGNGRPRIVGIGGTTRANSSSEQALRAVLTRLERAGAQCDAYCADNIKFPMYDPQDETRCEAALHLLESVRAADAVIVSTPGYHGGLSGMLKNALDYLQDLADDDVPYLQGRAVGCIASAYGWQAGVLALSSLRTTVHALRGWPTPLGIVINSSTTKFQDGTCADAKIERQLDSMANQLMWFSTTRAAAA